MPVNYAIREGKSCSLSADFAKDFLKRKFGELATEAIYANLPLYKRGPRKGQPKGWVIWTKCVKGGWCRLGSYDHDAGRGNGFVMSPGTHNVMVVLINPGFVPEGRGNFGLEADNRRGDEAEQDWANRCGEAIKVMASAAERAKQYA